MKKGAQGPGLAIVLALGATASFAALDTVTKWLSAAVPVLMAVWFRYLFQAVSTTVLLLPRGGVRALRTDHPRFHLARGLLLLTNSCMAFLSLKHLPVGEFTAIVMVTPLVITAVSWFWLKEPVRLVQFLLVLGGFLGTLLIVRPGGGLFTPALVFPLVLVVSNTAFLLLTSRLAQTERPMTLHFYTGWTGALACSMALPWVWQSIPDARTWLGLLAMGLLGSLGHLLLILAYQRSSNAQLMPFMYSQIGFAALAGWWVFGHASDHWSLLGMTLIAACGVFGAWLSLREHRPTSPLPTESL